MFHNRLINQLIVPALIFTLHDDVTCGLVHVCRPHSIILPEDELKGMGMSGSNVHAEFAHALPTQQCLDSPGRQRNTIYHKSERRH